MAPLSPAAPAYIPKRGAPPPWIAPPPPAAPVFTTYVCMAPPPPEFVAWPPMAAPPPPPPPPPCWSITEVVPFVPGVQGPFHGGVVPHGAVATPTGGPAPGAGWPRRHRRRDAQRKQRAGGPAPAPRGLKAAAGNANEAATNQPSPRSVLAGAAASPPISPTTSLPSSFPYQLIFPAPPTAASSLASAAAPSPAESTGSVAAIRPPQRRGRRPRGAGRAPPVHVRRTVKPRNILDPTSDRTSLMVRNIPNDFTRLRLMNILDEHCFIENEKIAPGGVTSGYDFLYLPFDFRTHANKGYAFVNMTSPVAARRLVEHLDGHRWAYKGTNKTCAVDYADRQGDALVNHFSGTRFDCHTEDFLPVRFEPPRDGTRLADPGAMHVVGRLLRFPRAAGDGK